MVKKKIFTYFAKMKIIPYFSVTLAVNYLKGCFYLFSEKHKTV